MISYSSFQLMLKFLTTFQRAKPKILQNESDDFMAKDGQLLKQREDDACKAQGYFITRQMGDNFLY